jgi:uncharacterized protein (DUF302 family)
MKKFNLALSVIAVFAFVFAVSFTNSGKVLAQDRGVVTVQSSKSFDKTVGQAKQLVAKNGMMVLAEVNQGKILSMTGIDVKGVSLFVGNPQVGNKLFTADRGAGLAVPVRLNIYEGKDGKTYLNYVKPSVQLASFNNGMINKIAGKLDHKLGMLTGMLSK